MVSIHFRLRVWFYALQISPPPFCIFQFITLFWTLTMAVLFLTKCKPGVKSVLQLLEMKTRSKESNSDGSIFLYIPASTILLQRMVWTLKLQQKTTSFQFALLSFEKFIEYKTCWSGIRSLQTTAAEVSTGVLLLWQSCYYAFAGIYIFRNKIRIAAVLVGTGTGAFLGSSSAVFCSRCSLGMEF